VVGNVVQRKGGLGGRSPRKRTRKILVFEKNGKKYLRNLDTGKVSSLVVLDINPDDNRESPTEELAGEEGAGPEEERLLSHNVLHLKSLYDFVRDHRKTGDDGLRLEGSAYGQEYSHLCKVITGNVDEVAGFYVWGRYDRKRYWHSIYLGKAGYKKDKKNLRKRILEELKDERAFVWRYIYDEAEVLAICRRIHDGRYTWKRPLLKAGATEIIWVPAPKLSDSEILMVEADLIEALSPSANLLRPIPVRHVQSHATTVFAQLREIIHKNRPEKSSELHRFIEARFPLT
jgi:hypothetical protein